MKIYIILINFNKKIKDEYSNTAFARNYKG